MSFVPTLPTLPARAHMTTPPACGVRRGMGCAQYSGRCSDCPNKSGLGALTDYLPDISGLPEPFNNWAVLGGIIIAVILLATGGTSLFRRGKGKRRALRMARLKATEERARILQQA